MKNSKITVVFLSMILSYSLQKRVNVLIGYIRKVYFLTRHSEKVYQFQNVEHTV